MPNLQKFREYHFDATAKVSENTRTLALSAVAIVWVLKTEGPNGIYILPKELVPPLLLIFSALALDFIQYLYRSIAWHVIFRCKEMELDAGTINESTELYINPWVNNVAYGFFYSKAICILVAYIYLLKYFIEVTTIG